LSADDEYKHITNWAPIVGQWSLEKERNIYRGPQPAQQEQLGIHKFGICVSDVQFSEGEATSTIQLPEGEDGVAQDASAYILFGYRSVSDDYLGAGLAGYTSAYTITRYEPAFGWRGLAVAGSKTNLRPNKPYRVTVRMQGQRVTLIVDGIRVLEYVLEAPIPIGQLGQLAWGSGGVEFSNTFAKRERGKVFVVMQFSDPYQELYTDVIQEVAKDSGLEAYHVGEVSGPGIILDDIVRGIAEAAVVIAEITPTNPNVFYELGYAHALRKPTILLIEKGKPLPFDISGYRCLLYDNSIGGKRRVEEGLRKHLRAILCE
jgi:hypothetical protein